MASTKKKPVKKSAPKVTVIKRTVAKQPAKVVQSKKGVSPVKVILSAVAVAGLGVGGYFLYEHFKGAGVGSDSLEPESTPSSSGGSTSTQKKSPTSTSSWKSGVFPLVPGMKKNNDVYALQVAMLQVGGAAADAIKNSGGADGSFGPGLTKALAAAGLPATIVNQAKLSEIIGAISASTGYSAGGAASTLPTSQFITGNKGADLRNAEATKDVNNVVAALSQIKSVAEYSQVNNNGDGLVFAGDFLRRTIVTKLLDTFGNSPTDRPKIEAAFLRIGLKKNLNNVWTLEGFRGFGSIENAPQVVMMSAAYVSPKGQSNIKVVVPPNYLVGKEISRADGFIEVMTLDNKIVVVPAEATKTI